MVSYDYLAGIARRLLAQRVKVHIEVMSGHPATNIVACAEESRHSPYRAGDACAAWSFPFALGSITEQVIRATSKPVVLLHPTHEPATSMPTALALSLPSATTSRRFLFLLTALPVLNGRWHQYSVSLLSLAQPWYWSQSFICWRKKRAEGVRGVGLAHLRRLKRRHQ